MEKNSKGLVGKLNEVEKGDLITILKISKHDNALIKGRATGYVLELNEKELKLSIEDPYAQVMWHENEYSANRANMLRASTIYFLSGFDDYAILAKKLELKHRYNRR